VTCPHYESGDTIKKGTTRKDAQRYRCQDCERIFNDLTGAVFAEHQLTIPEMFRIIRGVSKHHLQGYLDFLGWILNTDNWFEQILSTDFYR